MLWSNLDARHLTLVVQGLEIQTAHAEGVAEMAAKQNAAAGSAAGASNQ